MIDMETDILTINEEALQYKIKKTFDLDSDLLNLLLPLLNKLGWKKDVRQLIESLPHFAEKLTLIEFRNLMVNLGFKSEEKTCYLSKISQNMLPCLFISSGGETMLVESISTDSILQTVVILDGNTGKQKTLTPHQIINLHGTVYYFSKFAVEQYQDKNWFFSTIKKFRSIIWQIIIVHLLYNFLSIGVSFFIMLIYDKIIPSGSVSMLLNFSIGMVIVLAAIYLIGVLKNKMIAYMVVRLDKTVGYVIIKHILQLPSGYTENATLNNQIAKIKDFDNVRDFFSSNVAMLFFELPLSIIFLIAIIFIGGWMVIVPVMLSILFFCLSIFGHSLINEIIKLQNHDNIMKQGFIFETFANMRALKSSGVMPAFIFKFENIIKNLSKYSFKSAMINHVLSATADLVMLLAAIGVLGFGAVLAMQDKLSAGALIAVMLLTWKILDPLKMFFISLPLVGQIKNSINQVNNLINLPTEIRREDLVKVFSVNTIEFQRVSFRYQTQENASLLGVSFNVIPQTISCITGKHGSGKSTIIKLILALYRTQAGNIKINSMNINQIDPISLRKSIAYVPQDAKLFFGTIKQNLLLANPLATQAEIKQATQLANVHEDIMQFKNNYDTHLGDQGELKLSPNFRQKLILARAYLANANTLILDEPYLCSNYQEEQQFLNVLQQLKKNRGILIVTSKISLLEAADQIIYLKGMQVGLQGNPQQVLPAIFEEYGIK